MNPYKSFAELLFTCVNGPITEVVHAVLAGLNEPDQWSPRNSAGAPITQYFVKESKHDFSLAYVNEAERDGTKPQRVLFWEPRIAPGSTVFMGAFRDGMNHSVFRLSELSRFTWINVRIYRDHGYPGCFFDYYYDYRRIARRLASANGEDGWEFIQQGPIQTFEDLDYYSRQRVKDRLNREIITEYLEKLGFQVTRDAFWQTDKPAFFLWQERPATTRKQTR